MRKRLLALVGALGFFVAVLTGAAAPANAAPVTSGVKWTSVQTAEKPKHLVIDSGVKWTSVTLVAGPSPQLTITKFMTCYATGTPNIYRAQMWNYWTQYSSGEQRPSTNTVQFQKYINGSWVNNDWVTSANADLKWGSSVQQRVGPLNPPGRWNFNFSAPSGDRVQLRASGSSRSLDCTSPAP